MTTRVQSLIVTLALLASLHHATAIGTAFTYQGRLNDSSAPANGSYDLTFSLFGVGSGGSAVAGPVAVAPVAVSGGLFTVQLDFGAPPFAGSDLWLEIGVRTNGSVGAYSTLNPRQAVTATPYAILAAGLSGTLSSGELGGTYGNALSFTNAANTFTGAFAGNGAGLTNVTATSLAGPASNQVWEVGGNNLPPGDQVLGTTDNDALDLVSGGGLTLDSMSNQPINLELGGQSAISIFSTNLSTPGGATTSDLVNAFLGLDIGSFVGINIDASPFTALSVVPVPPFPGFSGQNPTLKVIGPVGPRVPGTSPLVGALLMSGGGGADTALWAASLPGDVGPTAIISGPGVPTLPAPLAPANGLALAVLGNVGVGAGGIGQGIVAANFFVGDGNGLFNLNASSLASGTVPNARLAGTYSSPLTFNNGFDSFTGSFTGNGSGLTNLNASNLASGTVPNGRLSGTYSNPLTFNNGSDNFTGSFTGSFTGDGSGLTNLSVPNLNQVWLLSGNSGTIPGVQFLGTTDNQPLEFRVNGQLALRYEPGNNGVPNAIGGFVGNTVGPSAYGAVIAGGGDVGLEQHITAPQGVIGGGDRNLVAGTNGVVGGGGGNQVSGAYATIAGGLFNAILTGCDKSSIGGGSNNIAAGEFATVPGGDQNEAAASSFAAGHRAKATNPGSFVWADDTDADFGTTGGEQFLIRASGGVGIGTTTPAAALDVNGVINCVSLNQTSDRNAKENFSLVSARTVLDKVAALPISEWNFKSDAGTRHVGPMAQDFFAAFGVGPDEKHIAAVDAEGVALAAIQGLNQKLEAKQAKIDELERRLVQLERSVSQTQAR